jgi:hypothetical protein
MYDPESISCQSCRRALPKRNFPAAYVVPRYYQWCTACIQVDQLRKAAAATAVRHDAPDVWAHRDDVLAAQQLAQVVPADVLHFGHLTTLLRAAVASSDDVPALLDTIADLRRELAAARRGVAA